MTNGEVATDKGGKMAVISKKINYLHESCKKNLSLSSEIKGKLLSSDPKETDEAEKRPQSAGELNKLIDHLQDLLDYINLSNSFLVSVNKEI